MPKYFDSPIFVLGLPRSGTSLVAGCLVINGAWAGSTVPGGGEVNRKGFFEHVYIRQKVVKAILKQANCDPLGVDPLPPLEMNKRISGLATRIGEAISADGYRDDTPWLYKDAKLTLLWPAFAHAFPNARWVIVNRDESSIIDSCLRTFFMNQHSDKRDFWENYVREQKMRLDRLRASGLECYEISPARMIRGDFAPLMEITSKLGLTYRQAEIEEFVSPADWHATPAADANES